MSLRPFRGPDDIAVILPLIQSAFQYPENESWSIQEDKIQSLADEFRMLRSLWPLMRVFGLFLPVLRDIMLGFIWEEDGKPVGMVNLSPKGLNQFTWVIGNVAVLPEYRRRGIARKLVTAAIDMAQVKQVNTVTLEVISDNHPAVKLYESLGFQIYGGEVQMERQPDATLPDSPKTLSTFNLQQYKPKDWRDRLYLAKRITPGSVQQFAPITENDFRRPPLLRPLRFLVMRFGGSTRQTYVVYDNQNDSPVAEAWFSARKREGGINEMGLKVDQSHPGLAEALTAGILHEVVNLSPGRRTEMFLPDWQDQTIEAARKVGFTVRCEGYLMGKAL